MYKKTVSGIMMTLLFIGMFTLAISVKPAKSTWTGTVYIRADGSIDPPDAPIITYDNITYVLTGNITSSANGIVVQRDNIIIDGDGYTVNGTDEYPYSGIELLNRVNVTIQNINVQNFYYGIYLDSSSSNSIVGNNITNNNGYGICLYHCSNYNIISGNNITDNANCIALMLSSNYNIITKNKITANIGYGIYLYRYSDCNVLSENNIENGYGAGISLWFSSNYNIISGNNITNNWSGIALDYSSNNSIVGNNITANKGYGISLEYSYNNIIFRNNIVNHTWGISLYHSSNNGVCHNNFLGNTAQVTLTESYDNVWDDGYPSGGNYWSDYNGTDYYSGPYQNETGSDGIGDTPYVIDEYNVDHYPLMNPYTITPPAPLIINATVDVNPKALNLRSRGRWITAYIELPEGYNIQDINASTVMLNDTISAEPKPIAAGDHDEDGILDLMVKFDRASVISYILANINKTKLFEDRFMRVALTITGYLKDGTLFQGTTTIRVLMPIPFSASRHWRYWRTLQVFPI